jgi:predicted membrane protein
MAIVIKILGFILAALMIYGGFLMLSKSQFQMPKSKSTDENKEKKDQEDEILDSNSKK